MLPTPRGTATAPLGCSAATTSAACAIAFTMRSVPHERQRSLWRSGITRAFAVSTKRTAPSTEPRPGDPCDDPCAAAAAAAADAADADAADAAADGVSSQ